MLRGNVLDQLLDQHSLADTGATEQTNLTALGIRSQKVNNFNSCLQHLNSRTLLLKARCIPVNAPVLFILKRFAFINSISQHIEQTPQRFFTNRNLNTAAGCNDLHILMKSLAGCQHDTTHRIVTDMLCHLHDTSFSIIIYFQSILDIRKIAVLKLHINDRT